LSSFGKRFRSYFLRRHQSLVVIKLQLSYLKVESSIFKQTMIKPAIQKIYVVLDREEKTDSDLFYTALSSLFSHVNLTSNIYIIADNLPESMPQIERIQKEVGKFLNTNLFSRLYLHFVHSVSLTTVKAAHYYFRYYYQSLKTTASEFDREGFIHQEVPRLILLPVIVPDRNVDNAAFADMLDRLKSIFMLPCIYLDENTFFLAQDKNIIARAEKIYLGNGCSKEPSEIACNMFYYDLLDDSLARFTSDDVFMDDPCPASLIISLKDGRVYSCMDAFCRNESFADIYGKSADGIVALYYKNYNSKRDCSVCRKSVAQSFAGLPVSPVKKQCIEALLSH